jgi:hypothetical protein
MSHPEWVTLRCEACDFVTEILDWDPRICEHCGSNEVRDVLSDDEDELNPDSLAALLDRQSDK